MNESIKVFSGFAFGHFKWHKHLQTDPSEQIIDV